MDRSRVLLSLVNLARTAMEKVSARIAVSDAALNTLREHVGGDALVIPNGVDTSSFNNAVPLEGWPGPGKSLVFLGRVDEPRKGLDVLINAYPAIRARNPGIRLLIAGPGDARELIDTLNADDAASITHLGMIADGDKANVLASGSLYIAPNTGGESFGIVLLEAMATGTPVVASNLPAFARVLRDGHAGMMFNNEDSESLAATVNKLLGDAAQQHKLIAAGHARAAQFDWSIVAHQILEVYESVRVEGTVVEPDLTGQMLGRLGRFRIMPEREDIE
jgi:phosphatidylinositol alpha-mannosyltransferase